jgi:hypothetical protein
VNLIDVAEPVEAGVWASRAGAARAGEQLVTTRVVEEPSRHREMWVARIPDWATANPTLDWVLSPSSVAVFDGFTVAEMLTVGDEAVALGNSYETGELGVWRTTDGLAWDVIDSSVLDGYTVSGMVASDADGLVLAVAEATPAGLNPRFARWTLADGWSVEADPVLGTTESAVVGACPDQPRTALDWAAIPGAVGAECFGDRPITFTAWWPAEITEGCGCGPTWVTEPRWLSDSFTIQIVESNGGVATASRSDDATVTGTPGSWVRLTGHWADAEASACRSRPDSTFPYYGLGGGPHGCSSAFVLTEIAPAP